MLILLTLILSVGAFSVRASASVNSEREVSAVNADARSTVEPRLSAVPSVSVWKYKSYNVSLWGKSIGAKALLINNTLYIPLRNLAENLGLRVSYNSESRTLSVSGTGIYLTVADGSYVTYANDRPVFTGANSKIMSDGRMYVPIGVATKAFGISYSRNTGGSISFYGSYKPLVHAKNFYRSDEVLWLSRIISAESRGEPLLGQIAVGTVVMNRVSSGSYPNTIYGVIFDKRYGIQFSPVADGSIYNTPTYNCTLAAKICLEGVRVGEGVLFFLRPETSNSMWIPSSRPFLFSIGNHDFYA